MALNFNFRRGMSWPKHNDGANLLAKRHVRNADHRCFGYCRMLVDRFFDFARRNVFAPFDDQIFYSSSDIQVAIVIDAPEVTCV